VADDGTGHAEKRSSLLRGLTVLFAIAERGETSPEGIAASTGLPLSTVYRYLGQLQATGLVARSSVGYGPGPRAVAIVGQGSEAALERAARPVLTDLVARTTETAVVMVRVGLEAMALCQVESPHRMRMAFRTHDRLPLHAGAGSRTLLAYAPPAVVGRVLDRGLVRLTPSTPDAGRLEAELQRVRRAGYAVSLGEVTPGAVAVARPIFSAGEVIGSIVVAGPRTRCQAAWQRAALDALRDGAAAVATRLSPDYASSAASRSRPDATRSTIASRRG
jgi:DNA-binding IclR family transcriptional regulator